MKVHLTVFLIFWLGLFMGCKKHDDSVLEEIALQNEPPLSFNLMEVPNGATNIDIKPTLSWGSAKNPKGSEVTYDLYLDTDVNPALYATDVVTTSYQVSVGLDHLVDYYWKVVARDTDGKSSQSTVSQFTTRYYRFSDDAITLEADFQARTSHSSVVFDDKMWVIGGSVSSGRANDVWQSSDGENWIEVTPSGDFLERAGHSSAVHNDKIWVIGGLDWFQNKFNDVWSSSDGKTWTEITASPPFSERWGHKSVVFDNKIWVIAGTSNNGQENDVWYSNDGAVWTPATLSAPFSERSHPAVTVFDDKIWVIGGLAGNVRFNDVWYSSDGVNWTEASASAPFSERFGHSADVIDNKIWVVAGNSEIETRNKDVWYTDDGENWTEATSPAAFPGRFRHSSVIYKNKLWVIGGVTPQNSENDVWAID